MMNRKSILLISTLALLSIGAPVFAMEEGSDPKKQNTEFKLELKFPKQDLNFWFRSNPDSTTQPQVVPKKTRYYDITTKQWKTFSPKDMDPSSKKPTSKFWYKGSNESWVFWPNRSIPKPNPLPKDLGSSHWYSTRNILIGGTVVIVCYGTYRLVKYIYKKVKKNKKEVCHSSQATRKAYNSPRNPL